MNTRRPYEMAGRAAAADETRHTILRSTFELSGEKSSAEIVLADVAKRSGVTVKTVLRHFGSRDGLFDAVAAFARQEIVEERAAPVGDVGAAVAVIVDHYEKRGKWVIRLLAQEYSDERIRGIVETGRAVHRQWVGTTFRPQLDSEASTSGDALTDLLVVATDVCTWKILRLDQGSSRADTEGRMRSLVDAVLNTRQ